jgi:enoyl-CoA hydratase/carnithine racemase
VQQIVVEVKREVGWITLNRPEQRNALCKEMWDGLQPALNAVQDAGARLAVLSGNGKAFASGADLSELGALDSFEQAEAHWRSIRTALNAVALFPLPTIAMIHGACIGGGLLLAAACDLRYCDNSAYFAVPTAQLGILLDDDNLARLLSLLGRAHTSELLLAGSGLNADQAFAWGLVNAVCKVSDLQPTVRHVAESIKENVPDAVSYTKQALARLSRHGVADHDQSAMIRSYLSPEFRQRVDKALGR